MPKLIELVLDKNFVDLKEDIESRVAKKLYSRIQDKKTEILAKMNGIPKSKMQELLSKGK
jgi:hypothetical protein